MWAVQRDGSSAHEWGWWMGGWWECERVPASGHAKERQKAHVMVPLMVPEMAVCLDSDLDEMFHQSHG